MNKQLSGEIELLKQKKDKLDELRRLEDEIRRLEDEIRRIKNALAPDSCLQEP